MGTEPVVARAAPHFGEEPCISGSRGSGAVFFVGCALGCAYCQNYDISRGRGGRGADLRATFDALVARGVHNINLVSGSHFLPAILDALDAPLPVPVVWNSSGYETVESLTRLEGKIQIYLPDFKYADEKGAARYSNAPDYPYVAKKAILEMQRQVGGNEFGADGLMKKGLIVRHLVLPGRAAQSILALYWIRDNLPAGTMVSLMAQYVPCGRAGEFPEIDRKVLRREYDRVLNKMAALGLDAGYAQSPESSDTGYIPAFDNTGVL